MKTLQSVILIAALGLTSATFTSCKRKGCTDVNANNYDSKAKKNNNTCTYPVINTSSTGKSGDISGSGGTVSKTFNFSNSTQTVGWDMSINSSSGSFQLVLKDASGAVVVDRTLTGGSGPQSADGTSTSGTSGTWTCIITLTKFSGTGDYSFQ